MSKITILIFLIILLMSEEVQYNDELYPKKNDSGQLCKDLNNLKGSPIQSEGSFQIPNNLDKDNNGNNNLDKDKQKEKDTLKLSQSFPENIGLGKSEQSSSKKINNFNFYRFRIIRR